MGFDVFFLCLASICGVVACVDRICAAIEGKR